jgi:hypothetical protein
MPGLVAAYRARRLSGYIPSALLLYNPENAAT